MKSLICLLIGHKHAFTADYSTICKRCRKEFYFDIESYELGFIRKDRVAFKDIIKYFVYRIYSPCPDCGKAKYLLGVRIKKRHLKCAPF
ncbi:MAG: hypothetical protein Q8933_22050 [Bacteroidota bacterium]|nr:hypothetical protein [Bacteroidota bacterium]